MSHIKVAKKYDPFLKAALRNGGRIEKGSKHLKVYAGARLVAVVSYSHGGQYEGRGDLALLKRLWRQEGWEL